MNRKTTAKRKSAILLALAGALVAGCNGDPTVTAAHKIADALPGIIGPAQHYDVNVDGNALSLARGHASRVQIDGKNVQVSSGLVMNTLHIDAHDMALNTKTKAIEHAGHVEFNGALGQINLDRYLAAHKPVDGLIVKIRWTDVEASIPVSAVGINTTVRVDGNLAPSSQGSNKLDFVPNGGQVGPIPIPHKLVTMAMDRLNPVLDLSGLKFPVTVESARAQNGRLVVAGTTTLGDKPVAN